MITIYLEKEKPSLLWYPYQGTSSPYRIYTLPVLATSRLPKCLGPRVEVNQRRVVYLVVGRKALRQPSPHCMLTWIAGLMR